LPEGCPEGWYAYKWGYFGSGFLQYFLKQPVLMRTFDVWSNHNENYYWEISQALKTNNFEKVDKIFEKYSVSWVLYDPNLLHCKTKIFPYLDKLKNYLDSSGKYQGIKVFRGQKIEPITIYKVNLQTPVKDFVFLASDLPVVNKYEWNNEDTAFKELGHYVSVSPKEKPRGFPPGIRRDSSTPGLGNLAAADVFYPFRSLFTGRKQEELEFSVEDKGDYWLFKSPYTSEVKSKDTLEVITPELSRVETVHWTEDLEEKQTATPSVELREDRVEVKIEKKKGYFSYDSNDDKNFFQLEPHSCNPFNKGEMERKMVDIEGSRMLRFESVGSSNCLSVGLPHFIQKKAYLVKVQSRHIQGKGMLFKVVNGTNKNVVIETELLASNPGARSSETPGLEISYFIVPPQEPYGRGYSLHFDNISIGREETINDLARIEVYPIPYNFLKQIKLISPDSISFYQERLEYSAPRADYFLRKWNEGDFQVNHPNPSFYKIQLDPKTLNISNSQTLVLSQSYHPGWKAFTIEKKQLLKFKNWKLKIPKMKILGGHVLINNWQNGWLLGEELSSQYEELLDIEKSVNDNQPLNLSTSQSPSLTIYLFFWPQLLEYLGFGFLIIFLIFLTKNCIAPI